MAQMPGLPADRGSPEASAGSDEDAALLIGDGELLATRVMCARPRRFMSLLVGRAIEQIVAQALLPDGHASAPGLRARQQTLREMPIREAVQCLARKQIELAADLAQPTAPWQAEEEMVDRLLEGLAEQAPGS